MISVWERFSAGISKLRNTFLKNMENNIDKMDSLAAASSTTHILDLNDDCLRAVFGILELVDFCVVADVCFRFRYIAKEQFQRSFLGKVELHKARRQEDTHEMTSVSMSRLKRLKILVLQNVRIDIYDIIQILKGNVEELNELYLNAEATRLSVFKLKQLIQAVPNLRFLQFNQKLITRHKHIVRRRCDFEIYINPPMFMELVDIAKQRGAHLTIELINVFPSKSRHMTIGKST